THGYTGADLAHLCREAAMKALRRILPKIDLEAGEIPAEILESLRVTMRDFMEAMREITPSAMREVQVEIPKVRWGDIGNLEDAKQQLREAVEWPIRHPEVFERMGITPPKGILLYGPPGCGKTLLAKAVATESEANFITIRGPEIFSKWVGESEKAIREVFRRARMVAPAVIFIDEIDAIAARRGYVADSGVSDRVVAQLLTEMGGILPLSRVAVIAATNRPDLLDPALLRPGRFDRLIYVPPPDEHARFEILKIHTRKMPLADDVDLREIARKTRLFTGAELEALCREAAMLALRENIEAKAVHMRHFEEAMKRITPTLTEDLIQYYETLQRQLGRETRRIERPQLTI
ncbi:AAA family ATPase, partial [archaeon]|nr:AAA family ATPase [archaeon]